MTAVRFAILGPVEVTAGGQRLGIGGPRTRAVLARLIVAASYVVGAEALAGELWPDLEAGRAAANLQVRVAELRRAFGRAGIADRLVTRAPGYLLVASPEEVDAARFDQLAEQGRALLAAGDAAAAAGCLAEALGLWRGPPLADAGDWDWAQAEAARLGEARLAAMECHLQARLDCGEASELTAELEVMTSGHRLRERLWGLRMLALYRSGRQAEALGAYQQLRTILVEELGIEPGAELRELHQQILAQDPALAMARPAAAAGPTPSRLPDQEPLAAAVPVVPRELLTNLPVQVSSFVGRDRELAEVRTLVASSRLVTLTGAGGSGKTRLGLQLAAGLVDGPRDGVWLVELAAVTDNDAVALAICQALGIAAPPGRPALDTLLEALASQDVLVVLDNCEHLIGGCAKTAEAIVTRCPQVRLLATSREPLGISGETIHRVPPLSLPPPGDAGPETAKSSDAVALFLDRAQAQGTGLPVDEQTAPLLVSVCARLDGLPLAIELAAARLRSMSLNSLHDRLDQRFRLLTGGSRTALERQQTLRATVEWSYSLLTGAEQELLGRLPVFAESFDLDAAEAVCGFGDIDRFDVAGLLGALVDKSLVVAEPAGPSLRYRMLETIRQFAADQPTQAGDGQARAAQAAHCAHFLSVAETAAPHLTGPDQGKWLARLDADQANLRRAAQHASGDPDGTARVMRLGVALKRYSMSRSRDEEALALLLAVLDRPQAQADPELFAAALLTAALAGRYVDIAVALRLGEQAAELARQLGNERLLIESLAALGGFYFLAGEPERGLSPGQEAVELARQLGDDVLLGESLMDHLLCNDILDPAYAEPLFTEAIAATQRSGDQWTAYALTGNAGVSALTAGDIPAARAYLHQAAQAMRAVGDENPLVPGIMGWVQRQDNDPDGARASFQQALRIGRRTGHRFGIAGASLGLACLAADTGDWHRAAELHGAAQACLDRTGQPWQALEACYRQASLDQIRAHLGHEQFERAYATGMALSPAQALDLAARNNHTA
jgi:predicted ATPase/DNA-binding SARP family transcriptional activator